MTRAAGLVLAAVVLSAGAARAERIAIVGAKVHVKPGQTFETATVVIDGGKIVSVTAGGAAPAGARVIDGKDKVVTAGFIETVSGVGLVGVIQEHGANDGQLGARDEVHADPVHAAYDARDGFDPRGVTVPIARSGGITAVVAAPDGGLVAGRSAVFTLDGSSEPLA
ncbi:MAG: hypothetical protein K8M05_38075, partial [Deltaproteobacteria bacterium]|nr:hypothetical protein [Kofleriaceae bacterium]